MGNRLHVAKLYRVKYADHCDFNWKIEEFHSVLDVLCVTQCPIECDDANGSSFSTEFEVDKIELQEALNKLQDFLDGKPLPDTIEEDDLYDCLRSLYDDGMDLNTHIKCFIESMTTFIDQSDPEGDWLRFSFF